MSNDNEIIPPKIEIRLPGTLFEAPSLDDALDFYRHKLPVKSQISIRTNTQNKILTGSSSARALWEDFLDILSPFKVALSRACDISNPQTALCDSGENMRDKSSNFSFTIKPLPKKKSVLLGIRYTSAQSNGLTVELACGTNKRTKKISLLRTFPEETFLFGSLDIPLEEILYFQALLERDPESALKICEPHSNG